MRDILDKICDRQDLTFEESREVFARVVTGDLGEIEIAALVAALKTKGERPAEIAGAARALRDAARPFPKPDFPYADTCGTGGDGQHTVNLSTAVAFLAAELGVPVAKHGNRSVSSKCGSADVLEACGARIDAPPEVAARCLREVGHCFLMAPAYHAGMRHPMPVRRTLRTRTIFNLLGPLVNPAEPRWQLMGVYDPRYCRPLAETLGMLGAESALVVHGAGLDEIALHGDTHAAWWRRGAIEELTLTPEMAGLSRRPPGGLAGGDPAQNATWLREILAGQGDPLHADAAAINAGALLWITGLARDLAEGTARALEALQSGRAGERLECFIEVSNA